MEDIKVDTLEDFYLTYSTIMIKLIDTDTLERMMVRVINDIIENKDLIIERIKKMDFKTRLLLGKGLFIWIIQEKYFLYNDGIDDFWDNYKEAFSEEVFNECEYLEDIKLFSHCITKKNDSVIVTIYSTNYLPRWYDTLTKAILKYNEKNNTLKLSYIETPFHNDKKYEVELFKDINKTFNDLKKVNTDLQFSFHKKYKNVYEKAIERKYWGDGIEAQKIDSFM